MNDDEKRQQEFDDMPLDMQMRILQSRKKLHHIKDNVNDMFSRFKTWDASMEVVKNSDNYNVIVATLFSVAEWAEKLKPLHDGGDLGKEWAREADWLRHIYSEQGIKAMRNACHIIEAVTMGDFEQAKSMAIENNLVSKEYKRIYNYWYNALTM